MRLLLEFISMLLFLAGVSFLAGGFIHMMARPRTLWGKRRSFRFAIIALPILTTLWAIGTYLQLARMVGYMIAALIVAPCYAGWMIFYLRGYLRRGR